MAEAKIKNRKDEYVFCSVNFNAHEWSDYYSSSDECYKDLEQDIIDECVERGYDDITTDKVLMCYKIQLDNYAGKWGNGNDSARTL